MYKNANALNKFQEENMKSMPPLQWLPRNQSRHWEGKTMKSKGRISTERKSRTKREPWRSRAIEIEDDANVDRLDNTSALQVILCIAMGSLQINS